MCNARKTAETHKRVTAPDKGKGLTYLSGENQQAARRLPATKRHFAWAQVTVVTYYKRSNKQPQDVLVEYSTRLSELLMGGVVN